MSGPKTAVISYPPAAAVSGLAVSGVVVAALALREAYRITQETRQLSAETEDRDAERDAQALRFAEAEATRRINVLTNATTVSQRLLQQHGTIAQLLPDLAPSLPALPEAPATDAPTDDWLDYLAACESAQIALDEFVRSASSPVETPTNPGTSTVPDLDSLLRTYLLERQRNPALSAIESAHFSDTANRILERLDRSLMPTIPPAIAALAREIVLAPNRDRAEALASELRLQVRQANESALAAKQREEQAAAAFVLEATLRDLGYAVDDIGETLFVEGGLIHFQKRGWGDYFVRLRIDAGRQTANFNVVRGGAPSEGEQRRADHLAEDRWCAEMPRLFEVLRSRGLKLDLQRHVAAGQLPVQVVDPASLPRSRTEETHRPQTRVLERPLD